MMMTPAAGAEAWAAMQEGFREGWARIQADPVWQGFIAELKAFNASDTRPAVLRGPKRAAPSQKVGQQRGAPPK